MVRAGPGLEVGLLAGGTMTATGLYVSLAALKGMYRESKTFFNWLLPDAEEEDAVATPETVQRRFMDFPRFNAPFVAREPDGGGGLLLATSGLFYLRAPSLCLYELCDSPSNDERIAPAMRPIRLLPHAYYLFASAMAWIPDANACAESKVQADAWERLKAFAAECLLHMLLNDIARHVWTDSKAHAPIGALFDLLLPKRASFFWRSGTVRRTAYEVLNAISKPQWRMLLDALPVEGDGVFRVTVDRDAFNPLGSPLPNGLIDTVDCWIGFVERQSGAMRPLTNVGQCALVGRMAYRLILNERI